jgi:hypothetical protein
MGVLILEANRETRQGSPFFIVNGNCSGDNRFTFLEAGADEQLG